MHKDFLHIRVAQHAPLHPRHTVLDIDPHGRRAADKDAGPASKFRPKTPEHVGAIRPAVLSMPTFSGPLVQGTRQVRRSLKLLLELGLLRRRWAHICLWQSADFVLVLDTELLLAFRIAARLFVDEGRVALRGNALEGVVDPVVNGQAGRRLNTSFAVLRDG